MTTALPRNDRLAGTRLGDYTIHEVLGRGGMARVYRGIDVNLGRAAAVKVLEIDAETASDDRLVDRFRLEARAIAGFEHPNIITVYQFGEADNLFFIAMKLVEGETLSQRMRSYKTAGRLLPPQRVLQIVSEMCSALDYAHERGIVHRDIKPANILFDVDDRAILTDFGLAMQMGGNTTMGTAFGTPRYIAPEQAISSEKAVPQSDIYSLAVLVFEMLTGEVPFNDESPMSIALAHITNAPPTLSSVNPAVPHSVEAVVLRALQKEPAARYRTAGEFYAALEKAYLDAGIELPTLAVAPPSRNGLLADAQIDHGATAELATVVDGIKPEPKRTSRRLRRILLLVLLPLVLLIAVVLALSNGAGPGSGGQGSLALPADVSITLELLYDDGAFALHNLSDYAVPLDDLTFEWGEGRSRVTYPGSKFNGPLPPGQCSWIRLLRDADRLPPQGCSSPEYSLRLLADEDEIFWAGDSVPAAFRVLYGGQFLQECASAGSNCTFTLTPSG